MATWQDAVGNRPSPAARRSGPVLGILLTVAGALLAIGSLLTWVTVSVKGQVGFGFFQFSPNISKSLTGTSLPHGSIFLASGIAVAGAGLLMLLFRDSRGVRIGMGAVALVAVGAVVWVLMGLLGQRDQLQAAKDSLQKIADSGGPLGFLVHSIEQALKGAIHVTITRGTGAYLAAAGVLSAAGGGIAAIVTGLLRRSRTRAPAVAPAGYGSAAGFGPQPGAVSPVVSPPAWSAPAPAPIPAAWPPGPVAPPGPPPAQPAAPVVQPAVPVAQPAAVPPTPPPMPGRGSHAPTVIERAPAPTPNMPTVVEQPPDPNELPPPRRRGEPAPPHRPGSPR